MTLEYAVLAAVIVAALTVMGVYVKRSLSGGIRAAADNLGEQYAPTHTVGSSTLTISNETTTRSELLKDQDIGEPEPADVITTTTTIDRDETTRTGSEEVAAPSHDLWER